MARGGHSATLIGKKIFFLGGLIDHNKYLNDFFFLDLSKSIDATKPIPFIDLSIKALALPPHSSAAVSLYGKDSIFLFGGYVSADNNNAPVAFSFNSTQLLEWNVVTVSLGETPKREATDAVTDNNNKIYIFSGGFPNATAYIFNTKMNIFDTVNKIWTISESGLPGRQGHTATFLPSANDIIYIGGDYGGELLGDLANLDAYNTQSNSWRKVTTKNPPESRYGHSAVLTNDGRIILFGGVQANGNTPVNNRYVVLDTKTFEWYLGTGDISTRASFLFHTATLYNDYMFIAFGVLKSDLVGTQYQRQYTSNVLIYKIGDYANFSLENSFAPYPIDPTFTSTASSTLSTATSTSTSTSLSTGPINSNNNDVVVKASLGSILGVLILGIIGFFGFKRYKKYRRDQFIPTE